MRIPGTWGRQRHCRLSGRSRWRCQCRGCTARHDGSEVPHLSRLPSLRSAPGSTTPGRPRSPPRLTLKRTSAASMDGPVARLNPPLRFVAAAFNDLRELKITFDLEFYKSTVKPYVDALHEQEVVAGGSGWAPARRRRSSSPTPRSLMAVLDCMRQDWHAPRQHRPASSHSQSRASA